MKELKELLRRVEKKLDRLIELEENRVGTQIRVTGWKAIAEYFPFSLSTLFRKGYAEEMRDAGFVYRTVEYDPTTRRRAPRIWAWEYQILKFITIKQAQQGEI